MGQYHMVANLDKKQFIHPHKIGNGLKLCEQCGWNYSTGTALVMLLAASNGRGGGDFRDHPMVGTWAGDRIAFIGDYAEPGDIAGVNAKEISERMFEDEHGDWVEISDGVADMMGKEFGIRYDGDGWRNIRQYDLAQDSTPQKRIHQEL